MQRVVLMIDIQVFTQGRLIVTEVRLGSLVKRIIDAIEVYTIR